MIKEKMMEAEETKPDAETPADEQQEAPKEAPKGPAVSPQVSDVFRRLLAAAMKLIYATPQQSAAVVEMVKAGGDPVVGIAKATEAIVGQLQEKTKGVPPDVVARVTLPVASLVAEVAIAAGVVQDDKTLMQRVAQALGAGQQPQQPEQPEGVVAGAMKQGEPQGGMQQGEMMGA